MSTPKPEDPIVTAYICFEIVLLSVICYTVWINTSCRVDSVVDAWIAFGILAPGCLALVVGFDVLFHPRTSPFRRK